MRRLLPIVLSLSFLCFGCNTHQCNIPIGSANCCIQPNSPLYSHLNNVGGYEYLTGGHRGLFVVRVAYDEFKCYERTCPFDSTVAVLASDEWGGVIVECPVCHSQFNTYSDGVPLDGSLTSCPLYQYSCTYDGRDLYIY